MALAIYTNLNNAAAPVSLAMIDTTVGSAPYDRPGLRTPVGGYVASTTTTDYGVGSTPAVRATCFEPQSFVASIDPGLSVSG